MELQTALIKLGEDAFNPKLLPKMSNWILVGVALSIGLFSTFAVTNVYAQTTQTAETAIVGTALASAGLITAVATAIGFILDKIKHSKLYSLLTERQRAFIDLASNIVNSLKGTDAGARDNAGLIAILAKMVTSGSPEAKKFIEENNVKVDEFQKNAEQWKEDFDKLYVELQKLPEESSSDEIIKAIGAIKKQTIPSDLSTSSTVVFGT